jgi:VanZ family protein
VVGLASVTPISGGNAPVTGAPVPLDLLAHVAGYAVLAALLVRARVPVAPAVLVAATFGVGIEGVQIAVATRTPSAVDALANLAGAVAGAITVLARRRHTVAATGQ